MITDSLHVIRTLCWGCGICAAVCPEDAIHMQRDRHGVNTPAIDPGKCSRCRLCARVCPVTPALIEGAYSKRSADDAIEPLLGSYLSTYAGHSTDESLRSMASSGGVVSALLLSELERRSVDAVSVVVLEEDNPFEPRAILTEHRDGLMQAMGSKYLPVELSAPLKAIIRDGSIKRVAIVGLPCHIAGIRRAIRFVPSLREKVEFMIGLFCKQTKDLRFANLVLSKMRVAKEDVRELRFRGDGWPGQTKVTLRDGTISKCRYEAFNSLWATFSCSPVHCMLCPDSLAESADVSVGDAWLDEFQGEEQGTSLLVVRTNVGADVVDRAEGDQRIRLRAVEPCLVVNAQPRFVLAAKRHNLATRYRVLSVFNHRVRGLPVRSLRLGALRGYLEALWVFGVRQIASSILFRAVFPILPAWSLRGVGKVTIGVWKALSKKAVDSERAYGPD